MLHAINRSFVRYYTSRYIDRCSTVGGNPFTHNYRQHLVLGKCRKIDWKRNRRRRVYVAWQVTSTTLLTEAMIHVGGTAE